MVAVEHIRGFCPYVFNSNHGKQMEEDLLTLKESLHRALTKQKHDSNTEKNTHYPCSHLDVILYDDAYAPGLYSTNVPVQAYHNIFHRLSRTNTNKSRHNNTSANQPQMHPRQRPCSHSRFKEYCHGDLVFENHDNKDTKVHRVHVHGFADMSCAVKGVVLEQHKERVPVSCFPCTTDMCDVRYVKCSSIRLFPNVRVCFESRLSMPLTLPVKNKVNADADSLGTTCMIYLRVETKHKPRKTHGMDVETTESDANEKDDEEDRILQNAQRALRMLHDARCAEDWLPKKDTTCNTFLARS